MIHYPDLTPENRSPESPDRLLWQSVIERAIFDASVQREKIGSGSSGTSAMQREQADNWLRRNTEDYRTVCALAGVDPDFLREAYTSGRIDIRAFRAAIYVRREQTTSERLRDAIREGG